MSYMPFKDATVYYEVKGAGKTIVFVHGLGLSHSNWKSQVACLTREGYQTVTIDIRGHGKSSETLKRFKGQKIVAQITNDIYQILKEIQAEKVILVGYSTGTIICQQFALAYPQLAAGLMLSGAFPKISNAYLYGKFLFTMGLAMINAKRPLAKGVARSNGKDEEQIHEFELEAKKIKRKEALRLMRESLQFDCLEQLKELSLPILVTYGGNERYMMKYRRDYLTHAPTAEVCLFPNVNHATLTKSAPLYNQVLVDYIKQVHG